MANVRKPAVWAVLTLLVLITTYGFYEHHLFGQAVWSYIGLRRFLLFAAAYAICFAGLSLWKPALFLPLVLSAVVAYTAVAAGPLALLSVCLFLFSSLILGQWILGATVEPVLSMLLGLSIYLFTVNIAVHAPVNYPIVYLLVLLAPLVWNHRTTLQWLQKLGLLFRPAPITRRSQHLGLGAVVFVLLVHWLVSLQPEVGTDALAMHLVVPSSVAMSHKWTFDIKNHIWAVMPMGVDWCYTIVYLLGGEQATSLLNFSFLLLITILLASRSSFLIAALFLATPLVQLVTGSLFAENLWALLVLGSVISLSRYRESRRPAYLYLTFLLLGAAVETKLGALSFLVPIGALAIMAVWGTGQKLRLARAAAGFLIFAAPPYLTSYAKTGNLVYPFLDRGTATIDVRFQSPLTWRTPYDLTFDTSRFLESQDGAAGFQYFLMLPLGILLLSRKWSYLGVASGITCAVVSLITYEGTSNLRYLYPALPLAMLFIGDAVSAAKTLDDSLYKSVLMLLGVVFCLDIYFLPSSDWFHKDFVLNPASGRVRYAYVVTFAPMRDLVEYLNRTHAGAPVAFFETNAIAGLRGPAFTNTWHSRDFYRRTVAAKSPEDYLHLMRDNGATFLVAPAPDSGIILTRPVLESFLRKCTEPEFTSGSFYVARLREGNSCSDERLAPPAGPGRYDDLDRTILYDGAWAHGRFPHASLGTVTYTNTSGGSFRFSFTGAEVTYVYTKAFNRGVAEILIDGVSRGTVDLYSPKIIWQSTSRFACVGSGPHVIEVRNKGDAFIDLDALEIR